jgi:iron complex outermembrane receptor protein
MVWLNDAGVSVEVIKGPASIIWFRCLGGVLYFNPEKFADANTFKLISVRSCF